MQNTIVLSVTQPSAAVSDTVPAQQIPMISKRLSLTETPLQNLLTTRAKSLLHTSKQEKVELPRCYCNNE